MLDEAGALVHQDPTEARRLAERAAHNTASPLLVARADYVRAQVHALTGEFETALELVEQARAGFTAAGASFEALRTQLGRIHVLNEQGCHDDAIALGQQLLADLDADDARSTGSADGDAERRAWLRATVHRNLAPCFALAGRHARALDEGRAAVRAYEVSGQHTEMAAVRHWLGEELLDLGRVHEAMTTLGDARAAFHAEGHTLSEARCLVDLGRAAVLLGRWADGLAALAEARTLLERLDVRPEIDQLLLCSAETWLGLGLDEEALVAYREAEASLRRSGQPHYLARVLLGSGAALTHLGRLSDAHVALDEAAELYRAAGNLPLLAQVVLEHADVHAREGDHDTARSCAAEAIALLRDAQWTSQLVTAHLRAADLALPDLRAAEEHLLTASQLCQALQLPPLQYRVDARLGHVRRLAGRLPEARACLDAAVRVVEQLRAALPSDALRTSFLRDAAAPYVDLVALELTEGDAAAAFDAAERSKSRALVDLMAAGDARTDAPQAQRGAVLRDELAAGYNDLLGTDRDADPAVRARRLSAVHQRVLEVEAALREEQLRAVPGSSPVGAPLTVDRLLEVLPPDTALLHFHVVEDEVVAFVLADGEVRAVEAVTTLSRVLPLLRQVGAQWQRFRAGGGLARRHSARLAAATRQLLEQLHEELIAPLGQLPGRRLVVVAHGPLHEVPFHALHDGVQWLLERHEVSVAPSASVLAATLQRTASSGPALVLGVPDEAAEQVADEAVAVAAALPGARLHLAADATADTLRQQAPGSSVVHIACHGLFRPESPAYSALRLGDTWLTAAELLSVDLDGALVALTACETGRSRVRGAGDEVLGLARAALGAGACAVLVSLWLVQDDVAARLVARWYELLAAGAGAAAALRTAQLELALAGEHPYHWAPFVLVGDPDARPAEPSRPATTLTSHRSPYPRPETVPPVPLIRKAQP
jgi:CHAT domain-containing protein/tetratricopeptide (TPR) repeat protein